MNLVVARSGPLTISELAAAGRGALLVPFAAAAGNHQEFNARSLENAGGEILWEDDRCRVVWAYEPDHPALCRVIWDRHVSEMADSYPGMSLVGLAERIVRHSDPEAPRRLVRDGLHVPEDGAENRAEPGGDVEEHEEGPHLGMRRKATEKGAAVGLLSVQS